MDDSTVVTPVVTPVFVDTSGRRRRRVRALTVVAASTVAMIGGLLALALLGAPIGPVTFLPDQPAPHVDAGPTAGHGDTPATGDPTSEEATESSSPGASDGASPTGSDLTPAGQSNATPTQVTGTLDKPDHTPPGRPTGLPQPPSRTR